MTISIINIARNSLKFSTVQIIGAIIAVLSSMYVATIIAPKEYGIYGFLLLWLTYATLIGPGLVSAGSREMPGLLGKGEVKEAIRIQNVSLTPEMLYTLLPFIVILAAAFFYSDSVIRTGMIIIAFSYLTARLANFWSNYNFIREKFNTVAAGNLIQAIAVPLITVILVNWLKINALILAPVIVNVIILIYYLKRAPINYQFKLDRSETFRLLKVGIILQGLTLVFWAYQLIDRTLIATMLTQEELGLYTFAIGLVTLALSLPGSFTNVLQPILWRHAYNSENVVEGFKDAKRIAVYLALGTAIMIPLVQLGFYVIVNWITTKYVGSISIFNVLSYNIFLAAIVAVPNLVLNSSIVNKQRLVIIFYAIGLVLNVIFDVLVIKLGHGVVGVAWVTVATQALITITVYFFTRQYMFSNKIEYLKHQAKILAPFVVAIGFFFLHRYLESTYASIKTFTGLSIAAQVVIWGVLIIIFYRDYISAREIKALLEQIKTGKRPEKTEK
ncbi:MAG: oligosaccharide flippase family protein [Dehalococcoidales bacterium]|nr:oligosaccharide flippase family protein [Dehalococcoidales bacterium]